MTPDQIQTKLNEAVMNIQTLQSELDKLKQHDPNHYIPQPGEVVEVSDGNKDFEPRIFLRYNNGSKHPFVCVVSSGMVSYRNGLKYQTTYFKYCRRLNGEIIEFGCDKKQPVQPTPNADNFHYIHLLPEGYEFCEEGEAEKWVKVEILGLDVEAKLGHIKDSLVKLVNGREKSYRPIRKIKYHVQVHEVVTAIAEAQKVAGLYQPLFDLLHWEHNVIATESELEEIIRVVKGLKLDTAEHNPYAVDWSKAPEWADVHCFEQNTGWFLGAKRNTSGNGWMAEVRKSGFTLPSGLDWTKSKTRRP